MSVNPYESPEGEAIDLSDEDATGGVIPYKNPAALAGYYCGVFSLVPCIGLLLGPPAFILGLIGLSKQRQDPRIKGVVHAWVGIVLGSLMTLLWGGLMLLAVVGGLMQ